MGLNLDFSDGQTPQRKPQELKPPVYNTALLVLLIFVSCVDMRETYRTRVHSELPLSVGSSWTYAYYDSLSNVRDTISVLTTFEHPLGDGSYEYEWQVASRGPVTSCRVLLSGTTVRLWKSVV